MLHKNAMTLFQFSFWNENDFDRMKSIQQETLLKAYSKVPIRILIWNFKTLFKI